MKSGLVASLALLAVLGCSPKEVKFNVNIVTKVCDPTVDPFKNVGFLKVRVLGPDITKPIESIAPTGQATHTVSIPQIPAGKQRVIEVRGYDMDPRMGGTVESMGRSLPFDVPDVIVQGTNDAPVDVTVFLRVVGSLTPISSSADPTTCEQMRNPRAGHSATVLKSGKVLIAGGYNFLNGTAAKQALDTTELYDPQTGVFTPAHEIVIANGMQRLPRAFHAATLLQNGQVLMWGGENYVGGVNNVVAPSAIILIYDEEENNFGPIPSRRDPPVIARTQASIAVDANGKVLVVGGRTRDTNMNLVPVPEVEWLDPDTLDYQIVSGVSLPRDGASVLPVQNGTFIAVAGGTDGSTMKDEVSFFQWDGNSNEFVQKSLLNPPKLTAPGRRAAAAATINGTNDIVLAGGYSDPSAVAPVSTSEVIGTQNDTVTPGATVGSRGDACAVTLKNGDVFVGGGRSVDAANMPVSVDSTVTIHSDANGGTEALGGPTLTDARYQHTCSTLQDGTVLITGGVNEQAGIYKILQDAWIYQPPPAD